MDTSAIKTEKEQRIQQLFEMSIEKCDSAVKRSWWSAIIGSALVVVLVMCFNTLPVQSIVLKVCLTAGAVLLLLISMWVSNRFNSQMSKARDVNELLRVNDKERKKSAICLSILMLIIFAILIVVVGDLAKQNIVSMFICIMLCVMFYFRASRDCVEVREIKKLQRES